MQDRRDARRGAEDYFPTNASHSSSLSTFTPCFCAWDLCVKFAKLTSTGRLRVTGVHPLTELGNIENVW